MGLSVLIRWAVMLRQVVAWVWGSKIRWADWKTSWLEAYGSVGTSKVGGLNARKAR